MYRGMLVVLWGVIGVLSIPVVGWGGPVAKVGSWTLDQETVDQGLAGNFYELREQRVHALVVEQLLLTEAAALKVDPTVLVREKVEANVVKPSEQEVARFIAANRDQLPNGGKGLEERIAAHMLEKREEAAKEAYLQGLWKKYGVEVLLEPPQFEVPGPQDLARGRADAPITVIEFSDFECPYCRRAQATLKEVEALYGDKVRFVFRHYPLPFHKKAPKASEAAQCAADQKKFWPYHDALFASDALELADLKTLAGTLQLDQTRFDRCLDSGRYAARVAEDSADGKALGISGTPTFFINGMRLVGAVPVSEFKTLIDRVLTTMASKK